MSKDLDSIIDQYKKYKPVFTIKDIEQLKTELELQRRETRIYKALCIGIAVAFAVQILLTNLLVNLI